MVIQSNYGNETGMMNKHDITAGRQQTGPYQTERTGSGRSDRWRFGWKPLLSGLHTALAFSALLLSGCQTTQQDARTEAEPVVESAPVTQTFTSIDEQRVTLRPGVTFSMLVDVDGINEIEESDIRLLQDGTAVLPMVGAVRLDGLTLSEASAHLSGLYNTYYQLKPLVRLQYSSDNASAPWGHVTVLGRVKKPGRVNIPPTRDLTVSGAIQGADGFDTSANLKAVRISRFTSGADGSRQMVVNMDRIGAGEAGAQDPALYAGDIVYVPETIF